VKPGGHRDEDPSRRGSWGSLPGKPHRGVARGKVASTARTIRSWRLARERPLAEDGGEPQGRARDGAARSAAERSGEVQMSPMT